MQERVAVLYRVSTKKQLKKRSERDAVDQDLPLQRIECEKFIASKASDGWVHSGIEYIEGGVSGFHTHTLKRKALMRAYDDAKAGKYDVLLVYKLDRFGRRSSESLQMALQFIRYCRIWVVDKAAEFKQASSVDELMNFIEFWSAKNASLETKRRVTDAMLQLFDEGCWTGGQPPYGYVSHKHRLEIDPREAEIVRQVFDRYVYKGWGYNKIAAWLNEQGIKPRHTDHWSHHQLMGMVRLPVYKGYLTYGKHKTVDTEFGSATRRVKQSEWKLHPNKIEDIAIIDEDTWDLAQTIREKRKNLTNEEAQTLPSRTGSGQLLFGGMCYCSCGSLMGTKHSVSSWNTKEGRKRRKYLFYYCYSRDKGGKAACNARRVAVDSVKLEKAVTQRLEMFVRSILNENILDEFKRLMDLSQKNATDSYKNVLEEIKEYTIMKRNAENMLEQYFLGRKVPFPPERVNQMLDMADEKLKELEHKKAELSSAQIGSLRPEEMIGLKEIADNWEAIFDAADHGTKKEIVQAVIEKIVVQEKTVDIDVKFDTGAFLGALASFGAADEVSATVDGVQRLKMAVVPPVSYNLDVVVDEYDPFIQEADIVGNHLRQFDGEPVQLADVIARLPMIKWRKNTTGQMNIYMRHNPHIVRVTPGKYAYK